jgi:hypothetical protein
LGRSATAKKKKEEKKRIVRIGCSETSVRNYHYSLRYNPEDRSSHLLRGGSLKERMAFIVSFDSSQCCVRYRGKFVLNTGRQGNRRLIKNSP